MVHPLATPRRMLARVLRQWADWVSADPDEPARRRPKGNHQSHEVARPSEDGNPQGPFAPRGTRSRSRISTTPPQHWAELVRDVAPGLLSPRETAVDVRECSWIAPEVEMVAIEPTVATESSRPDSVYEDAGRHRPSPSQPVPWQHKAQRKPATSEGGVARVPVGRGSTPPSLPPRSGLFDDELALPKAAALDREPSRKGEELLPDVQSRAQPIAGSAGLLPASERLPSPLAAQPGICNFRSVVRPGDSLVFPQPKYAPDALRTAAQSSAAPRPNGGEATENFAPARDTESPRSFTPVMAAGANPAAKSIRVSDGKNARSDQILQDPWPQIFSEEHEKRAAFGDPRWPELLEEQPIVSDECAASDRWERATRLIHEQRGEG